MFAIKYKVSLNAKGTCTILNFVSNMNVSEISASEPTFLKLKSLFSYFSLLLEFVINYFVIGSKQWP